MEKRYEVVTKKGLKCGNEQILDNIYKDIQVYDIPYAKVTLRTGENKLYSLDQREFLPLSFNELEPLSNNMALRIEKNNIYGIQNAKGLWGLFDIEKGLTIEPMKHEQKPIPTNNPQIYIVSDENGELYFKNVVWEKRIIEETFYHAEFMRNNLWRIQDDSKYDLYDILKREYAIRNIIYLNLHPSKPVAIIRRENERDFSVVQLYDQSIKLKASCIAFDTSEDNSAVVIINGTEKVIID